MNFDQALRYLLSLGHETVAIKLGLGNIERLLHALDDPQNAYRAVQIAGTNGKGSTAVVLDRICRAAGIETGLYTSPHLVSITERIRTSGLEIAPEEFARLITIVSDAAHALLDQGELSALPTFFEHVTAAALVAFKEARVGLAILETGLGGRLDATTVARAATVAITPIALDHQEHLGHSLAEIAAEKAAIIRPGVVAIVAPQPPEALEVILKRCAASNVTPRLVDSGATEVMATDESGRLRTSFKTEGDYYEGMRLGLLRGYHQLTNVATAIAIAEALRESGFHISRAAIREGVERAEHRGRLELWEGRPSILFDGAHNAAGARALRAYLDTFIRAPITLIFGAMRDKALDELTATLFPAAERIIITQPENPRAATPAEVARAGVPPGTDSSKITLASGAGEALAIARAQTPPRGLICITGSLYLVGEMQRILHDERAVNPHPPSER
ncbi:MAG TPA: cyanophycin synthetase [Pyrinomonadaceae bacterium]|jgi:dihydrofolate synthase/folylpolyglutamate synthase|nr:cyanophycin synthetase [Pyrinomonadaceae bacterium]